MPNTSVEVKATGDVRDMARAHAKTYELDPATFILNYNANPPRVLTLDVRSNN